MSLSPLISTANFYTCQLFLRYKREIFILGVLGFSKTTRSFLKIPEEFRSIPMSYDAYKRELAPSAFYFKNQRSRGQYCHLFILHMVFVPYMGLSSHIFWKLCQARRQQLTFSIRREKLARKRELACMASQA